jgi:hypothetical protein
MSWRLAESLKTLRRQIDGLWPGRSKVSDGTVGNLRHKRSKSDHNPNAAGVVTAIDITHDPLNGPNARRLAEALVESRDPRIKYIISNGQIVSSKQQPWVWRKYTGDNAHTKHVHISVMAGSAADDTRPWAFKYSAAASTEPANSDERTTTDPQPTPTAPPPMPVLRRGDKGENVRRLQMALRARGYSLNADADFGPATERAVKGFQTEKGLRPDGIAGPNTYAALGLK